MTTYTHAKPAGTPTWSDLLTPDIDAARAFYHAVFGWDYDIGGPEYGGYTTARLGTRMTVGMSGPPPGVALRPAAWALVLRHRGHRGRCGACREIGGQGVESAHGCRRIWQHGDL